MAKPSSIKSVSDLRAGINILVYGDNGVGKTPFLATSPKCLILNADPPDSVLSAKSINKKVDVWQIPSWDEADQAHEYLRHEKHGYEWVWLDSLPGLQEIGLGQIMEDLHAAKPHRNLYIPDKHEYLENMNRLRLWVRHMTSLPFCFGMTAHPFRYEIEEDMEQVWPWVQGKNMPQSICGFMNIIGFMRIRKSKKGVLEQVLYTKKLPKYYARDRYGVLPSPMVNPTIPKIEQLINEALGQQQPRKANLRRVK